MASSALANPTDVLKVRMQASSTSSTISVYAAFKKIYNFEGIRGLWRVRDYFVLRICFQCRE